MIGTWDSETGTAEFWPSATIGNTEYPDACLVRYSDFETTRDGSLKANVLVHWNLAPHTGLVKEAQVFIGKNTSAMARDLSRLRVELTEGQWGQIMERTAKAAKAYHEQGEPFLRMGEVEPPPMQYLLRPMVAASGVTVLAAAGGTGKSMLALALSLTVATGRRDILGFDPKRTGPVLYIDYEESGDSRTALQAHDERLFALCRGVGISPPNNIIYTRERVPLYMGVKSLVAKIRNLDVDQRPVMVVIDSIGKALGGDPNSAADTIRFFNAADQLRLPIVGIHHKSKESIQNKRLGPTGSMYAQDLARVVWDIEGVQLAGHDRIQIVARNNKVNRTRKQPAQAWNVQFENDDTPGREKLIAVTYETTSALGVRPLDFTTQSTVEAVEAAMKDSNEPMSIDQIVGRVGKSEDSVRKALHRNPDIFTEYGRSTSGKKLWELVERDVRAELPGNII